LATHANVCVLHQPFGKSVHSASVAHPPTGVHTPPPSKSQLPLEQSCASKHADPFGELSVVTTVAALLRGAGSTTSSGFAMVAMFVICPKSRPFVTVTFTV
jgi:hypothetical protein